MDAIKAYLKGISEDVDCEFVYTTLSTYDEATNLTAIQNLISAGCEGIILTADMGTVSILEECEAADVYLAGFLCDFNQSFYTAHDDVFGNPNFLGTVCDGWRDASPYGEMVAEEVIAKGYKNVGILVFPAFAYPNQMEVAKTFMAKIDEYNATAAVVERLTAEGFQVDVYRPSKGFEGIEAPTTDVTDHYDALIYVANYATKSNQTVVRLEWAQPMGADCPMFLQDMPNIFISLENPYHLVDVPRMRTYINTYGATDEVLDALIEKLTGRSAFKGKSPVDAFCGMWDTHLM